MNIFKSSKAAHSFCRKGSAIAIGNYDGVHLGHRAILKLLIREARKRGVPALVYTFEPHPVKLLAPAIAPKLINTQKQKIELLEDCHVDAVVFEKFDCFFASQSAQHFFERKLLDNLNAHFITVGYDFTFGKKRKGNIETLEILCFKKGIDVKIMEPRMLGNTLVSSSLIRKYVDEGAVDKANPLLKRPFYIDGHVVQGATRGRRLGIPTVNLKTTNELIPKNSVYATKILVEGKTYKSVTNIGTNPTFCKSGISIETHILNFKKEIYGKEIRLFFLKKIREEKRFDDSQKLLKQIKKDIEKAKKI